MLKEYEIFMIFLALKNAHIDYREIFYMNNLEIKNTSEL